MKINDETKYCQTCGIPLDIDYTNLRSDQNEEYCNYCLENGVKQCRFMVGVILPKPFKVPKGFGIRDITPGEYAIFRFKGLYHELNSVYRYIYLDWLPTSNYILREQYTFETYINTPEKTPASELITDIYIPIIKKEK